MKTLTICIIGFLFPALNITGNKYYVSPVGSPSNSGTKEEPWSLDKANKSLLPGDTVILLIGVYRITPIAPTMSGSKGAYITYRSEHRHGAVFQDITEVLGSKGPTAIFVNDKSYISIEGIKVKGGNRWVEGTGSHHISLSKCHFTNGSGWINCRFDEIGDGMKITGCYFSGGTDLLSLDGGSGHLVENNFFGDASHTGLVLLGVQNSVIRNNTLANRIWRCMEVESQRHGPYRHSKNNLIENNYFNFSATNTIQYAGSYSILRHNIFRHGMAGIEWANYLGSSPEAWHDAHNRFYNNLITECGANDIVHQIIEENRQQGINPSGSLPDEGFAMSFTTDLFKPPNPGHPEPGNCGYGDNISVNNIFYKNSNTKYDLASKSAQIAYRWNATPEFAEIYHNNIFNGTEGEDVFYFHDAVYQNPVKERNNSISEIELQYPENVYGNLEVDPKFIDNTNGNYHLSGESGCIDHGVALTKIISNGQGTIVPLADAIYFTDGLGLIGPDTVLINSKKLVVTNVNYELNTITVDQELTWEQGDEVFFDFEGSAPDFGAFEYGKVYTIGAGTVVFGEDASIGLPEQDFQLPNKFGNL